LKAVREREKITYKGKPIKITEDFSTETLKARRAWSEEFQALKENNFNPRIFYSAKLLFKIDGAVKVFHDKQKLKQYTTTKPQLQKMPQGILHTKMKANKTMRGQTVSNHRRRKDKESESNTDSVAHNQTLKQKNLNDRIHHIPINISTECQWT
jgi:hypothetical protein